MITITENEMTITKDELTTAYLPTNGSGRIELYADNYIVATFKGKVSGICLVNGGTRWGIVIELLNDPSFNCIYADRICRGE